MYKKIRNLLKSTNSPTTFVDFQQQAHIAFVPYLLISIFEAYLGKYPTSTELSCENKYLLKAVTYFDKNSSEQMIGKVLNTPLQAL